MRIHPRLGSPLLAAAIAAAAVNAVPATDQPFATIGGGPGSDKLRFDPGGAANLGGEIGRFWQSTHSAAANNFSGGCPSAEASGGWWQLNQAPLRGIQGWIGNAECQPLGVPAGHLTLVVEEQSVAGDTAFFIALRVDETPTAIRWWDFSRVDPSPSPSVLPMVELPKPVVLGSQGPPWELTLYLQLPDVAAGVHAVSGPGNTPLPASAVIASYDLYRVSNDGVDPGRDASLWTLVHQEPYAGGPGYATVSSPCDAGYLYALGVSFDGGAGPDVPSALVGKPIDVECGVGYPDMQGIGIVDFGQGECVVGETFLLRSLCGDVTIDLWSSEYDLSAHACEIVQVGGPNIDPGCLWTMEVETLLPAQPGCLVQVSDLRLSPAGEALAMTWEPLPCTDSYDVIRGTLPVTADLGAVTCLAEDVPAPAAEDTTGDSPPPGESFFYLVRATGSVGSLHYGYTSAAQPRLPSSGDCR